MTKTHLLGALATCLLVSAAPLLAADHGWICKFENTSDFPMTVQSNDNGYGNAIEAEANVCAEGQAVQFFMVGCAPFVVKPDDELKTKDIVVPYQAKGTRITMTISKPGKTKPVKFGLQERVSDIVILKGDKEVERVKRNGNAYFFVKLAKDGESIELVKQENIPDWQLKK